MSIDDESGDLRQMNQVVFVLEPHFSLMSFTAAADALITANLTLDMTAFEIRTLGVAERTIVSDIGIRVDCDAIATLEGRANASDGMVPDVLLLCGGYRCRLAPEQALDDLLQELDGAETVLGGLWNGVLHLARLDLMGNRECALHAGDHARARQRYPDLALSDRPLVLDRQRWSAAGPNSSLDLMLALIRREQGADTVDAVRAILRADMRDPGHGADALARDLERHLPTRLRSAIELMRYNLDEPLARQELAHHVGLSTRALERLFRRHLDTSPARHYLELRLARARELLVTENLSISEIGLACGFVSAAHFSRAFSARFELSPRRFRETLQSGADPDE